MTASRLKRYMLLSQRAISMVQGKSYFHVPQGIGAHFEPGKLNGYYKDYRAKVNWDGPVDEAGIPLNRDIAGDLFYLPVTIIQKALAHWDCWLDNQRQSTASWDACLMLCDWLLKHQDENEGWVVRHMMAGNYTTPYSGMYQGQATSILLRVFSVTHDDKYLQAAACSLNWMLEPIEAGGMTRYENGDIILEEFPRRPTRTIFNGWISALYGLYDFTLVAPTPRYQEVLAGTVNTVVRHLKHYDSGYWSYYDSDHHIASPFYHAQHQFQLAALARTFPEYETQFDALRLRFEQYAQSHLNLGRAVGAKIWEKIVSPPATVMR